MRVPGEPVCIDLFRQNPVLTSLLHLKSNRPFMSYRLTWHRESAVFTLYNFVHAKGSLKGQCHEIFNFRFFSWISFPQAPEYPIRAISNFFQNSRKYSQLKVHPLTLVANLQPVSLILVAVGQGYRWHWCQICNCFFFNPQILWLNLQSQISEICESANFFWLISKFCWWASPQVANPQIFHNKTERIRHLFKKF